MTPLDNQDRWLITEARRIGAILRKVDGDAERSAGWLLEELAGLAERLAGVQVQSSSEETS